MPTAEPSHPAPKLLLPPGCDANLSGTYQHAQAAHFHYQAQDDGRTLQLVVQTELADGGQTPSDTRVILRRTEQGFTGSTVATAFTSQGNRCQASFPTEVVGCPDGGLLLRAESSTSLDFACRPPARPNSIPRVEHLLVRDIPDAGEGR